MQLPKSLLARLFTIKFQRYSCMSCSMLFWSREKVLHRTRLAGRRLLEGFSQAVICSPVCMGAGTGTEQQELGVRS